MVRMSGNSNPSRLGRMLILAMTPSGCYQIPTVLLDNSDHITNFHYCFLSPIAVGGIYYPDDQGRNYQIHQT